MPTAINSVSFLFEMTIKKNDDDRAWVLEILKDVELIVDSYEQPIQRPTDNEEQKKNYSGKQKRHTKKNQVIVMPSGKEIVDVVVGETGATADINIWRKQRASLETSQKFQGDKAYVGEPLIRACWISAERLHGLVMRSSDQGKCAR
ncbi:transposase family protein [Microcoleus vaginatus]|uniref:transposase family protein n=1 Tax=Microcoleus vaginatus TaxID=119532 RepID=UPI001F60A342